MLQQTQVETVKSYFAKFLKAFPNVRRLAAADEEKVLRLWEGLGYYRRARQLHAAARKIVDDHGGKFPTDYESVLALPGVGRYTAGAILSLSLDQRLPIVEANTIRLYSRLIGYRDDPTKSAGQKVLWQFAEEILPKKNSGELNSAMMDLGSMVCKPQDPACGECPVASLCSARLGNLVGEIPLPKQKTRYTDVTEAAVVVRSNGKVLVRRCAEGERWAGLWDFPRTAVEAKTDPKLQRELTAAVKKQTGVTIRLGEKMTTMRHGVTRYRITLHCFDAQPVTGPKKSTASQKWLKVSELNELPLSVTGRKISEILQSP